VTLVPKDSLLHEEVVKADYKKKEWRLPAVMATPQAGEASQEMMAKMNASMAAILRLAEMNR